jgi:hypothetical protein
MKFKQWKKAISGVGLAVGLALGAGAAQSANLISFQDDDVDFIVRATTTGGVTTFTPVQTGNISLGDIIVTVQTFNTLTVGGVNGIPAGQQLTGVGAVQVNAIAGNVLTFGAYTGGLNSILALGTGNNPDANVGAPGNAGGGAAVALFLNGTSGTIGNPANDDINLNLDSSSAPATNCGATLSGCIYQGSVGTLYQLDGFRGDPDESWIVNVPSGLSIPNILNNSAANTLSTTNVGLSNFSHLGGTIEFINVLTGQPCGNPGYIADGCVQVKLTSSLQGGQGLPGSSSNNPGVPGEAFAHSDIDGQKWLATAPEPGTLALLGLGLAGLGFGTSRRKKVAA